MSSEKKREGPGQAENKKKFTKKNTPNSDDEDDDGDVIVAMDLSAAYKEQQKDLRQWVQKVRNFEEKLGNVEERFQSLHDNYLELQKKNDELKRDHTLFQMWLQNLDPHLSKCPLALQGRFTLDVDSWEIFTLSRASVLL